MSNKKPPGANRSTDCKEQAENNNMEEEDPEEEDPYRESPPSSEAQIREEDGGSPCEAEGAAGHSTSTAPGALTVIEKRNFRLPPSLHSPSSSDDIKKGNVPKEQATALLGVPRKDDVSPKKSAQDKCIDPKSHDEALGGKSESGLPPVTCSQQAVVAFSRPSDSLNCPPDGLPFMPSDLNSGGNKRPGKISPHIPNKPETPKSSPKEKRRRERSSSQHTDPASQASRTRQTQARNDDAERGARSAPTDEQAKPEKKAPSSTQVSDEETHKTEERVASHQKQYDSVCSSGRSDVSHNESRTSLKSTMDELGLYGLHEIATAGGREILEVYPVNPSGGRSPETRPLQQSSPQSASQSSPQSASQSSPRSASQSSPRSTSTSSPQSILQSDAQLGASASCSTHEQTTNEETTSRTENNAAPDRASNQSPCTEGSLLSQNRVSQAASQPPSQPEAGPVQASASPPPCSRRQPTPVRQLPSASLQSGMSQGTPSPPVLFLRRMPARQSPNSQQRAVRVQRPVPQSSHPCGTSVRPSGWEAQGPRLRPRGNCSILAQHHSGRQRHEDQQGSRNTPSMFVVDLHLQAVDMSERRDLIVDARDLHTDIDLQQQHGLPREITGASELILRSWGPHPEMAAGNAERFGLPARFQRFLDERQTGDFAAFLASLTPGGTATVLCVVCQVHEVNVHLFPCHHRPLCHLCLVRDRLCRCPLQHCCRLVVFFFQFRH